MSSLKFTVSKMGTPPATLLPRPFTPQPSMPPSLIIIPNTLLFLVLTVKVQFTATTLPILPFHTTSPHTQVTLPTELRTDCITRQMGSLGRQVSWGNGTFSLTHHSFIPSLFCSPSFSFSLSCT